MAVQPRIKKMVDDDRENFYIPLNHVWYIHKCISAMIEAPINAIENGKMADGYATIRLASFFARKFAWAGGIIDNDAELDAYVSGERDKLLAEGYSESDDIFKVLIAVAVVAFIQKRYNEQKIIKEGFEI